MRMTGARSAPARLRAPCRPRPCRTGGPRARAPRWPGLRPRTARCSDSLSRVVVGVLVRRPRAGRCRGCRLRGIHREAGPGVDGDLGATEHLGGVVPEDDRTRHGPGHHLRCRHDRRFLGPVIDDGLSLPAHRGRVTELHHVEAEGSECGRGGRSLIGHAGSIDHRDGHVSRLGQRRPCHRIGLLRRFPGRCSPPIDRWARSGTRYPRSYPPCTDSSRTCPREPEASTAEPSSTFTE